jgi:hypothetical protein
MAVGEIGFTAGQASLLAAYPRLGKPVFRTPPGILLLAESDLLLKKDEALSQAPLDSRREMTMKMPILFPPTPSRKGGSHVCNATA